MNAGGSLPYITPIECLTAVLNTSQCQEAGMRLNGIQHDTSEFWVLLLHHFFKKYRPLSDIFEGVMLSKQTCQQCSHSLTTHQPFKLYTLQMDLPLTDNRQTYDLYTLMEHFHRGEVVSRYSCAQCDTQNSIDKQLSIISAPTILVVHLARFRSLQKIDNFVRFPAKLTISYRIDENEYDTKSRITGLVIHKGNSIEGHYFAYVRRGETWLKADDETVIEARWETARRKNAYLLFY